MRTLRLSALLASALWALAPQVASAESGKAALVIGNGAYRGGTPLAACSQSARDVGAWLKQRGFEVEEAIDATSVAMRSAIGNFVTLASGAPKRTAIIYVCTYAAVSNQRLFMLPVDLDPGRPMRLETQGVILKALLSSLAGTNGVLFADLGVAPDQNTADAIDALQSDLPAGAHFAVVARNDAGIGSVGQTLPQLLGSAGQDWGHLAAEFQTQHGPSRPDRLAVFAPPLGPMPVQEDTPAAVAQSEPAAPPAEVAPQPAMASAQQELVTQASEPAPALTPSPAAAPEPASSPPTPAEPAKAPAGAPLQLVPSARPAVTARQVASTPGVDRPGSIGPDAAPQADPPAPARATPPSRPEDTRTGRIQAALARRGFYSGVVNGRSNGRTRDAIRAFQNSIGDPPSGVLTQIQIAKLLNLGR